MKIIRWTTFLALIVLPPFVKLHCEVWLRLWRFTFRTESILRRVKCMCISTGLTRTSWTVCASLVSTTIIHDTTLVQDFIIDNKVLKAFSKWNCSNYTIHETIFHETSFHSMFNFCKNFNNFFIIDLYHSFIN